MVIFYIKLLGSSYSRCCSVRALYVEIRKVVDKGLIDPRGLSWEATKGTRIGEGFSRLARATLWKGMGGEAAESLRLER